MMDAASRSTDPGPARRRYDNGRRREQAAATREAVHRAAFRLLSAQGYASTTLPQIAAAAGVSTETVRKLGPKSDLLDGAREVGIFDESGIDGILDADFMQRVAAQEDLDGAVDVLVDFYAASNERAAAFLRTWQAAALDDPVVAVAWKQEMASAREAFGVGISFAASRGWLRDDVSTDELAATLWVLASSETFTRLTDDAGMSRAAYRAWLGRVLREQLGPRPGG